MTIVVLFAFVYVCALHTTGTASTSNNRTAQKNSLVTKKAPVNKQEKGSTEDSLLFSLPEINSDFKIEKNDVLFSTTKEDIANDFADTSQGTHDSVGIQQINH